MIKIDGKDLSRNQFPEYTWNADLVYLDGPLISLYRRNDGPDALFFWVDSNKTHNRWAVAEVNRSDLKNYLKEKATLLEIINSNKKIYFLDTSPSGRRTKFQLTTIDRFPESYLPDSESFLYSDICTEEAKRLLQDEMVTYDLLLDGDDIYMDDLAIIPKTFQQLYSFHYGLSHLDREAIKNKLTQSLTRWTGGFTAVHLFSGLKNLIPSIHKARVKELKYASPGFIKMNLIEGIAKEISVVFENYLKNQDETEKLYKAIYKYFKDQGISGFDNDSQEQEVKISYLQEQAINSYLNKYLVLLGISNYQSSFNSLEVDALGQIRSVLAYYRRLKILGKYVESGTLKIPTPEDSLI